ncbi:hypothetical protein [Candidatus Villigracilis saccharophilus]|uniref:hypothetical protein n=1 Tax=Candidatus Villigracilis saccharophilus TaxID=3140684 RepID=UPI00313602EB|nr:hypothetical protein [Anaerolineales bacterium]
MVKLFDISLKNRRQLVTLFFALMAISGIGLFGSFVYPPSEEGAQFFLGLSRIRFVVAGLFLGLLLLNIGLTIIFSGNRWASQKKIEEKLKSLLLNQMILVLAALYFLVVATGTLLLLTIPPIPVSLLFLESLRVRLLPLIVWLFLCSSLLIVLLRLLYYVEISHWGSFVRKLDSYLLVVSVFLFTFFFYTNISRH